MSKCYIIVSSCFNDHNHDYIKRIGVCYIDGMRSCGYRSVLGFRFIIKPKLNE